MSNAYIYGSSEYKCKITTLIPKSFIKYAHYTATSD